MQSSARLLTLASTLCAALLLLFTAADAQAQRHSNTRGFFLNVHLNGTSISYDEERFPNRDNTDSGGGAGLKVGYGISPLVTFYLGLNGSSMQPEGDDSQSYTLAHVDLGAQFNFGAGRNRAVPYAELALTARQATVTAGPIDLEIRGGGITAGGGLKYFLSPMLALDGGLNFTFGTFTEVEVGAFREDIQDIGAVSARLAVGLSWYPSRR